MTQIAPFYDCGEQWEIRIYDSPPNIQCGNQSNKWVILACQNHEKRIVTNAEQIRNGNYFHYVNTIHIYPIANEKDVCGNNVLSHEILHAQGLSHVSMAKEFDCPKILEYDIGKNH